MQAYQIPNIYHKKVILALGAESAGNFSLWENGTLHFSQDFGDLANEQNFSDFKTTLLKFFKDQEIKPDIILSDLHPLFETTKLAQQLAKKYKAQYFPVQHHHAHVFSALGEQIIEHETWSMEQKLIHNTQNTNPTGLCEDVLRQATPERCQALDRHEFSSTKILAMTKSGISHTILGIACDGTGLGTDGKIWGGEVFKMSNVKYQISNKIQDSKIKIQRIGHLENQVLLGGEMAIQEPARFIIAMINKFPISNFQFPIKSQFSNVRNKKQLAYELTKKYYSKNEFEVLWSQLEQNFNCLETSSTARVLDAVSVLLRFSKNERLSKHGPIALLEENSTKPYLDIKPKISNYKLRITNNIQDTDIKPKISNCKLQIPNELLILNTTCLFEYLIKNLHKDKKRLAATAQKYIADGMVEIITIYNRQHTTDNIHNTSYKIHNTYFASGGMTNNKIISETMEKQGFYLNKKIPRGDAGLSFGQIMFCLLTK